jgi:hypothetical protein
MDLRKMRYLFRSPEWDSSGLRLDRLELFSNELDTMISMAAALETDKLLYTIVLYLLDHQL